jgi:heterodisulfide reductase subunit C
MKYGLTSYIRYLDKILSAGEAERKQMLHDPTFWNMYQAQSVELYYECFECLTSCPVGRRRAAPTSS